MKLQIMKEDKYYPISECRKTPYGSDALLTINKDRNSASALTKQYYVFLEQLTRRSSGGRSL